jgi:hypothetical protein
MATKFCTVAPNICEALVWSLLSVTILVLRILRWSWIFKNFKHPCNKVSHTCKNNGPDFQNYLELYFTNHLLRTGVRKL